MLSTTYITPKEYLQYAFEEGKKYEYFAGKTAIVSATEKAHNTIVSNLTKEIAFFAKDKNFKILGDDCRLITPTLDACMFADIAIVYGEIKRDNGAFESCLNQCVIIEVMNKETINKDQGYKFFYYMQIQSLQEYILIDSTKRSAHRIRRQCIDSWKFERPEGANSIITIKSVGLPISFDNIYSDIDFS